MNINPNVLVKMLNKKKKKIKKCSLLNFIKEKNKKKYFFILSQKKYNIFINFLTIAILIIFYKHSFLFFKKKKLFINCFSISKFFLIKNKNILPKNIFETVKLLYFCFFYKNYLIINLN